MVNLPVHQRPIIPARTHWPPELCERLLQSRFDLAPNDGTKNAHLHPGMQPVRRTLPASLLLVTCLGICSGCITSSLIEKTQTHSIYDVEKQRTVEIQGQPGYYALLPLTIVAHIVTSPFQLWFYAGVMITGDGP